MYYEPLFFIDLNCINLINTNFPIDLKIKRNDSICYGIVCIQFRPFKTGPFQSSHEIDLEKQKQTWLFFFMFVCMDEFEIQMQNVKTKPSQLFFHQWPENFMKPKNTQNWPTKCSKFLSFETLLIYFSQAKDKKTESENQTNENSEIKTENTDATDSAATDNANDNENENENENENATNDTSVAATS